MANNSISGGAILAQGLKTVKRSSKQNKAAQDTLSKALAKVAALNEAIPALQNEANEIAAVDAQNRAVIVALGGEDALKAMDAEMSVPVEVEVSEGNPDGVAVDPAGPVTEDAPAEPETAPKGRRGSKPSGDSDE